MISLLEKGQAIKGLARKQMCALSVWEGLLSWLHEVQTQERKCECPAENRTGNYCYRGSSLCALAAWHRAGTARGLRKWQRYHCFHQCRPCHFRTSLRTWFTVGAS